MQFFYGKLFNRMRGAARLLQVSNYQLIINYIAKKLFILTLRKVE